MSQSNSNELRTIDVDFKESQFKAKLRAHLQRQFPAYFVGILCFMLLASNYRFAWSYTESLPFTFFVIKVGEMPKKGDYAAFRFKGEYAGKSNRLFLKRVAGVNGDQIHVDTNRDVIINGFPEGKVKEKSREGKELFPLDLNLEDSGFARIGYGKFYMQGTHPDSFDSRYKQIGLVGYEQIEGRAFPLVRILSEIF